MMQQQQQKQHSRIVRRKKQHMHDISAKQRQIINFKTQKYKGSLVDATVAAIATHVTTTTNDDKTNEICCCNRVNEYNCKSNTIYDKSSGTDNNNTSSSSSSVVCNSRNTTQQQEQQQYQQWRRQQQNKVKLKNLFLLFSKLPTTKQQHNCKQPQQLSHQQQQRVEKQQLSFIYSNQMICHSSQNNTAAATATNTQSNNCSLEAVKINKQRQQQRKRQRRRLLPPQLFITIMLVLSFLTVQHVSCQRFMSISTATTINQFKPNSYLNNAELNHYDKTNYDNRINQQQQQQQQQTFINYAFNSQQHSSVRSNDIPNTNSNLTEIYKIIYSSNKSLVSDARNYNYKAFFKRNNNKNSGNSINGIITKSSHINNNNNFENSISSSKIIDSKYVANKLNTQVNNVSSLIVKQNFYKNTLSNNDNNKIISNILPMQKQQFNNANSYIENNNNVSNITQFVAAAAITVDDTDTEADELLNLIPNRFNDTEDNQQLMKLVMDGLGLQSLPNIKKANVSQQEYALKYREYLRRIHKRRLRELFTLGHPLDQLNWEEANAQLHILTIAHNVSEVINERRRRDVDQAKASSRRQNDKATSVIFRFPLDVDTSQLQPGDLEEANIRFMLITSSALAAKHQSSERKAKRRKSSSSTVPASVQTPKKHLINLKVYQLLDKGRRLWLDGQKIEIEIDRRKTDETYSRWLEFDVTKAVENWLSDRQTNLGLEVKCDNCYRYGARIIDDLTEAPKKVIQAYESNEDDDDELVGAAEDESMDKKFDLTPVLNIIGHLGAKHQEQRSRTQSAAAAAQHYHTAAGGGNKATAKHQPRRTNCYKDNQRCCRHTMEVIFKEIKGFEFIIQPKVFDAGYCRGRCPPRYNPAHHHALLQSLIWKQDRTRAPHPCCAPSKLVELEVLHVDEKDSEKLKISTWTDMRVLECACS